MHARQPLLLDTTTIPTLETCICTTWIDDDDDAGHRREPCWWWHRRSIYLVWGTLHQCPQRLLFLRNLDRNTTATSPLPLALTGDAWSRRRCSFSFLCEPPPLGSPLSATTLFCSISNLTCLTLIPNHVAATTKTVTPPQPVKGTVDDSDAHHRHRRQGYLTFAHSLLRHDSNGFRFSTQGLCRQHRSTLAPACTRRSSRQRKSDSLAVLSRGFVWNDSAMKV